MSESILITLPFPEPTGPLASLKAAHPTWTFTYLQVELTDTQIAPAHLANTTILYTFNASPPTLSSAPNLKWIAVWNAGLNKHVHSPFYTSSPIPWTTSSGVAAPQIAELVLAGEALLRRDLGRFAAAKEWPPMRDLMRMFDVPSSVGARVGVFGYGAIGRHVARLCAARGSVVVAHTASPRLTAASRADDSPTLPGMGDPAGEIPVAWFHGTERADVHAFLAAELDWLVICAPLTEATRRVIGADELAILGRRRAFLTNVARGELVQTDALVAALKPGEDGGASLLRGAHVDVTDPEPLGSESELWGMENVLITPHVAALVDDFVPRTFEVFQAQLGRWERGEELVNVVSRDSGY